MTGRALPCPLSGARRRIITAPCADASYVQAPVIIHYSLSIVISQPSA
ncbi:MAG: hypothetical protein LBM98_03165 [Oscillospiraceae bacterium]|nr:hypothetical protein [Oscillospiraceae bacterium]